MSRKSSKENAKSQKLSGAEGFEHYYSELYGQRWQAIKASFAGEGSSVEYKIPGAEKSYFLDSASVLAALCLPLDDAEDLLDLCAAPGGKTLVLASRMSADAKLSSNERSPERKHRLSTVVQTCLPPHIAERVTTSCSDGATWCTRQTQCFDHILLDAPCSSERHVIADPKYLNAWSPSRIKTVTTEQWALLSSAYRLLSPQGILLYSTCALCPQENDGMIDRLLKKFGAESFEIQEPAVIASGATATFAKQNVGKHAPACDQSTILLEKSIHGHQILPDTSNGAGPIYFSLIKKL
jgi:16S rRNA C967 or C1407 C5-methylase (RsmB/RsmF family)